MQRMAAVIRLRPHMEETYLALHEAVWPEVLATIADCGIRNYGIFLRRPELLLFASWEYHGQDFTADMERMRRSGHATLVGADRPVPGGSVQPRRGRVVGADGRGVPP